MAAMVWSGTTTTGTRTASMSGVSGVLAGLAVYAMARLAAAQILEAKTAEDAAAMTA